MNVIPFEFESKSVRVVKRDDGDPLFVAKDLAEGLGYVWNGTARIEHVPEEWRGVTSVVTPSGVQEMAVLTERYPVTVHPMERITDYETPCFR